MASQRPADLERYFDIRLPSPEQTLKHNWENPNKCQLFVKRDDLIHSVISGNKWRKLKHALREVVANNVDHILSFGGGYSNHIHALAYCCHKLNIRLTAVIRGRYGQQLTPMLKDIQRWGAEIEYVDKLTYQKRDDPEYLRYLREYYPGAAIIPEGGSQLQALEGIGDIHQELFQHYDYILSPVASGGTLAGLISSNVSQQTNILGIAVLKGEDYLESLVSKLLPEGCNDRWSINHKYHCGGYAKAPEELKLFCDDFNLMSGFSIEPVYSGKVFYAAKHLLANGSFEPDSNVLLLHTGGLQGAR